MYCCHAVVAGNASLAGRLPEDRLCELYTGAWTQSHTQIEASLECIGQHRNNTSNCRGQCMVAIKIMGLVDEYHRVSSTIICLSCFDDRMNAKDFDQLHWLMVQTALVRQVSSIALKLHSSPTMNQSVIPVGCCDKLTYPLVRP